ncbi:alpha-hydroxy-acid oxidizing protein [Mycobacteroides abscessus]|uniref:Lactate 2-monooxygenase n=1 Tax=Mycobacteroides abscessus TaxID=36809 RepID=A0ABD7HHV0_9MYCO|nr:alpha-hydroxy-acid oxidizing protein [Mycobacteroides abscessus]AWG62827.1 lactate 2-monooxygenase [Mycobacteroides abscessus]PVA73717.1 lactate 2-monooxygenase [Mycobacteroides abscessus]PVB11943.1 lactate 2-monooxygenase [Mycobacteroides abscessus]PVB16636.1 lactate 2-monooxygenase [Mycobacteroides abscessus]RIR41885.1 lactate 2-monooxygenase [Mycobacteroides abscessus]
MRNFGDFQHSFYSDGVANRTSPFPFTFAEWESRAQQCMNPLDYGYVRGGAGDEHTQDINVIELQRYGLIPRMLRDRTTRDLSVTFLGRKFSSPIFACPVGVLGAVIPNGDLEVARVCDELDIVGMYSTLSSATLEEVAEARGKSFGIFQLYPTADQQLSGNFVRRAEAAGFDAIAVTVDTGMLGWRPRDLAHGYIPMLRGQCIANYISDPRFRQLASVPTGSALEPYVASAIWSKVFANPCFTWDDIRWLRRLTDLPIIVKGICLPEDAARARREGVDVIACSNHGGRQANGGLPAISHLQPVIEAAGGLPVTFDSGIRSGVDVLRACGLGAALAGIGRPYVYALAAGGRTAVKHCLSSILAEADLTMAVDCYSSLDELTVHKLS